MNHKLLIIIIALIFASSSFAIDLYSSKDGERYVGLDISGKLTSLASHAPEDAIIYPDRDTLTEYFRLRFGLNVTYNDWINGNFAYEQSARWLSSKATSGTGSSFLPSQVKASYRIEQLDWEISETDKFLYRHEIDRAYIAMHPKWGQATIGRQGIGLGRGTIFSAVDIFAPFSPLEVDREWRRGVDAIRIEKNMSDTSSVELICAFGESWEKSALLGRARGYIGDIDGELLFGKRARDTFVAGVISASVMDAEVHSELAFFRTHEEQPESGLFSNRHETAKFVLGSSYTFNIGNGLTWLTEYHYSGFGLKDVKDISTQLLNQDFRERTLRGDMQILGRQAIASQFSYPFRMDMNGSLLVLQSLQDSSGTVSPSINWDFSQHSSLIGSVFVPWGDKPSSGIIQSEYGATPISLFIQLRSYF
ncbi:MAG: hypothetical protein JXA96_11510 [Sedimentisphaerales bacterium]|nr:hypothetical protein [Sedimentisphaerales bacterium]